MVAPIQLSRHKIAEAPYEVWNAFVKIALVSPYTELDATQRIAHHALWYESELNNGGHLQYFENRGTAQVNEVIAALAAIGATCQANVLLRAVSLRTSRDQEPIVTVQEYVGKALAGEFDELDSAFYECDPTISTLLETYLAKNESAFVERVD